MRQVIIICALIALFGEFNPLRAQPQAMAGGTDADQGLCVIEADPKIDYPNFVGEVTRRCKVDNALAIHWLNSDGYGRATTLTSRVCRMDRAIVALMSLPGDQVSGTILCTYRGRLRNYVNSAP